MMLTVHLVDKKQTGSDDTLMGNKQKKVTMITVHFTDKRNGDKSTFGG